MDGIHQADPRVSAGSGVQRGAQGRVPAAHLPDRHQGTRLRVDGRAAAGQERMDPDREGKGFGRRGLGAQAYRGGEEEG
ncbi:MAG: hypothetical protein M0C28_30010 [Candidatus Moduliflexus flocculans]|nr:hypothetical protein [Candidatus Moduliflexus flocculans]